MHGPKLQLLASPLYAINLQMKHRQLIILLILSAKVAFGQINQPDSNTLNESGIRYIPIKSVSAQNSVIGASFCKGTIDKHPISLTKIGITPLRLKNDCNCTVGDFDGNGYLDFAFWGIDNTNPTKYGVDNLDYENYVVLFFNKSLIINEQQIKTDPGFPLVYYPIRSTKGPNGEPITSKESLWIWGETNGYDDLTKGKVFIYDAKNSKFDTIKF